MTYFVSTWQPYYNNHIDENDLKADFVLSVTVILAKNKL